MPSSRTQSHAGGSQPDPRFRPLWNRFTRDIRTVTSPNPSDRPLDQMLPFREKVVAILEDEMFVSQLGQCLDRTHRYPGGPVCLAALYEEVECLGRSVEVAQKTGTTVDSAPASSLPSVASKASVVMGSFKDFAADAPPYVKMGLVLGKELLDLFKGK